MASLVTESPITWWRAVERFHRDCQDAGANGRFITLVTHRVGSWLYDKNKLRSHHQFTPFNPYDVSLGGINTQHFNRGALCLVEKLVGASLSSRPAPPSAGTSAPLNAIDYVMQVKAKWASLAERGVVVEVEVSLTPSDVRSTSTETPGTRVGAGENRRTMEDSPASQEAPSKTRIRTALLVAVDLISLLFKTRAGCALPSLILHYSCDEAGMGSLKFQVPPPKERVP
ncbi:hypothetical protein NQZ68_001070 [Dissostichus eleginoides]|nr:hypothetical protein NQZ68_001070 [Dissostichus eleginoides]